MLQAKEISFSYGKGPLLFDGLSLSIESEERVYLSAPSGFGKTTLCRLLSGYEIPLRGDILADEKTLPQKGVCPVQLIGQHPELTLDPRMRMKDSLGEAGDIDDALLCDLGIRQEWFSRYPHELSGGELQRFCIARALMAEPRYLVADEISTMLDAVTQARIWRILLQEVQKRGIGFVFTTHSPALAARIATREVDLISLSSKNC